MAQVEKRVLVQEAVGPRTPIEQRLRALSSPGGNVVAFRASPRPLRKRRGRVGAKRGLDLVPAPVGSTRNRGELPVADKKVRRKSVVRPYIGTVIVGMMLGVVLGSAALALQGAGPVMMGGLLLN